MTALLLDAVVKATVMLAGVLALDIGLRRISAADRHLMWTVAAASILLLPLLSATVPSVRWPAVPVAWAGAPTASVEREPEGADRGLPGAGATGVREVEETIVLDAGVGSSSEGSIVGTEDASASEAATRPGVDVSGIPWWMVIWATGAGTVLLGLLLQSTRRVQLERRARPFGPGRVRNAARDVADDLGLRRLPRLLHGESGVMPSTWGLFRRRLLLPEGAAAWSDERLRSVLAHELAHLRRGDGAAQLVAAAACVVYWFHPLAWLAARRMASERELACDDEVLRLGAPPGGYARCLVELARETRSRPLASAVATSMARESGLARRVDSVLARGRPRSAVSGRRAGLFGVTGLLLLLPVASLQPLVSAPSTEPVPDPVSTDRTAFRSPWPAGTPADQDAAPCWVADVPHSMKVHHSDDDHLLRWEGESCVSEIRVRGVASFDEDFDDVTGLSDDGLVRVEENAGGTRRAVEFRPDGRGGVIREFLLDGRSRELTAEDRRWIEARIVTLLRQTGLAAGERVSWILSREGPDGVFREVERMSADRGQALYLDELLARADLDDEALRGLLRTAGSVIGSDSRMAWLLERVASSERDRVVADHRDAFRAAAATMGSDGEMTRLLLAMTEAGPDDPAAVELVLDVAGDGVGSDGDMARLLVEVADVSPRLVTAELRSAYRRAAGSVGSDGDMRRALTRLVEGASGDPALTALALEIGADGIGSDGDMAAFLVAVAQASGGALADPSLREPYLRALGTVGSDGDEDRARRALERAVEGRR